jgi:hypothetical protein
MKYILLFLISLSSFSQTDTTKQINELSLLGSIRGQRGNLKMSKKVLKSSIISVIDLENKMRYEVLSYKIKINYNQIFNIEGYRLTEDTKEYIDYVKKKSKVVIFDIVGMTLKKEKLTGVKPIYIELTD